MRRLASAALAALIVFVLAAYLPPLYDALFLERIGKTHLFYSPVIKRFVYTERVAEDDSEAAALADDHHADIVYRDSDGNYYGREQFERLLPFIYYKNMELRGLLPLRLDGRVLDAQAIERERQAFELKPREIVDRAPPEPLLPLLESDPGQVGLVFPEDRFRLTASTMEFVNADVNAIDEAMTNVFTSALTAQGFVFPARLAASRPTILKPFDDGVFLVDAEYAVFHVKRVHGQPVVVRTSVDPGLRTRHIAVVESRHGESHGLLLDGFGRLHVLMRGDYRLVPLPLEGYDPDRMDFKLLVDPLNRTAVYSDEEVIRAVAMDADYRPLAAYERRMSRATRTTAREMRDALLPFSLRLRHDDGDMLRPTATHGGVAALAGIAASLLAYAGWSVLARRRAPRLAGLGLIGLTGVYGLIAALLALED